MMQLEKCPAFGVECQYVTEVERLRMANRFLRRGLYGLMDSDDADDIATALEAGGIVNWDKYPPSARAALGDTK